LGVRISCTFQGKYFGVQSANRRLLGLLSLGHLSVDVTGGALPAILPFLQRELHLSYLLLAAVIMTSNVTSSIVQPIFGVASDRAPARWLLPAGVLFAVAGFAALGVAPNYWLVLVAVGLSGVGSAIYHPEASKSASFVAGARRATGMSMFSVGGNIGFALGPLVLLAIVGTLGLRATWVLVVPGIAMAAALAAILPSIARAHMRHEALRGSTAVTAAARPGRMSLLVAIVALRSVVYGGMLTFVPLYAINVLHRNASNGGLLLFLILGAGAAGTVLAGPIADRIGKKPTMLIGMAFAPPLLGLFLLAPGIAGTIALALAGASLIGTFTVTLLLGQELMPNRLALASALMIGFTSGIGGLAVGALGRLADVAGLTATLWALVAAGALGFALALALPAPETAARGATADLRTTGSLESAG